MLELKSVKEIVSALTWLSTLGLSDIKDVKAEVKDLIAELSKSLTSLWDVATQIASIEKNDFGTISFNKVYDYFMKFYVGDWNISPARTHCGNVERAVGRIKFKISKRLHADLGKWSEVDAQVREIVERDGDILYEYDESIRKLDAKMREIKDLLNQNKRSRPKVLYFELKDSLEDDIRVLREGINRMENAINVVNKLVG